MVSATVPAAAFFVIAGVIALAVVITVTVIILAAVIGTLAAHPAIPIVSAAIAAGIFLPGVASLIFTAYFAFIGTLVVVILVAIIGFTIFPMLAMTGATLIIAFIPIPHLIIVRTVVALILMITSASIVETPALVAIARHQITAVIGIRLAVITVTVAIIIVPVPRAFIPAEVTAVAPFLGIIPQAALDADIVIIPVPRRDLGRIGAADHIGAAGVVIDIVGSGHGSLLIA